ncbi:hypothetical protein N7486_009670 [Penicillium sp. IBT 16267x]|nr:hypothetical protein N7486_009670 [Penicillium sp. IBT 16267x]
MLSLEEIPTFLEYILAPLSETTMSDNQSAGTHDYGPKTSTATVKSRHITEIIGAISLWFEKFQRTYDLFTCLILQPEASEQPLLKRAYFFPDAEKIVTSRSTCPERDQTLENIQGGSVNIESVFVQRNEALNPTKSYSCDQELTRRQTRGESELPERSTTSEQATDQLDGNLEHQALLGSQNEQIGLEHQGNESQSIPQHNTHNPSGRGVHQSANRDPILKSVNGPNGAIEKNSLEQSESGSEERNPQEVTMHLLASQHGIFNRTSHNSASLDSQVSSASTTACFVSQQESLSGALRSAISLDSTGASHSRSPFLDPQQKVFNYGFHFDQREVLHPAFTEEYLDPHQHSFSQPSPGGFPFDPREVLHPAITEEYLDPHQQSSSQPSPGGFPFDPREVLHPALTEDFLDPHQHSFSLPSPGGFPFDAREVLHPAMTEEYLDPHQQSFSQPSPGGFPFDPREVLHLAMTEEYLDPHQQSSSQPSLGSFPFDPREVLHPALIEDFLDPHQHSFSLPSLGGFPFDPREVLYLAMIEDFLDPHQHSFSLPSPGGFPFDPREVEERQSTFTFISPLPECRAF